MPTHDVLSPEAVLALSPMLFGRLSLDFEVVHEAWHFRMLG